MKNIGLIGILGFLLLIPSVLAINIDVEKETVTDVIVIGLDQPAVFKLDITNNRAQDNFDFYNLFGWTMEPKEKITIGNDKTEEVTLKIYPRQDTEIRNFYTIPYYIRGDDDSEVEKKITVKIIDLEDAFEIGSSSFDS